MPFATTTVLAVAAIAVSAASAGAGIAQSQKAAKARKKSNRINAQRVELEKQQAAEAQKQQEIQARRSRKSAIREQQIKRAAIINFAAGSESEGSTPVNQALTSVGSQAGAASGFASAITSSNRIISNLGQRAADLGAASQFLQGSSQLASARSGQFFGISQQAAGFGLSGADSAISDIRANI